MSAILKGKHRVRQVGVTVVARSNNHKLGKVASTWSTKYTCPSRCPFYGKCYPKHGPSKFTSLPLDDTRKEKPIVFAKREAKLIDKLNVKTPLRLKVYGDAPDRESAQVLRDACHGFMERTGQPVWGYTHAWDVVEPEDWGKVSILASCETAAEVEEATQKGWATALVVPKFLSHKRYVTAEGVDITPCPNQTAKKKGKKITCDMCKLCMDKEKLLTLGTTIGFEVHNDTSGEIKAAVKEKNDE